MRYVASFDIGTTSTKGILIAQDGSESGQAAVPSGMISGGNGYMEQDPEQWWKAVTGIVNGWWKSGFNPEDVVMITFSGQMEDCIPVNCSGKPVRNAILYSDTRASGQAQKISDKLDKGTIRKETGNHFDGQMTFPKILWILENEPHNYDITDSFLISSKDYIIRQLTGRNVTDPTSAATTGMMEIKTRKWLYYWLEQFGIKKSCLPELISSDEVAGYVNEDASSCTGFKKGTPVLCGAGDAGATTIGAGVVSPGETYAYLGTTGWVAAAKREVSILEDGIFHLAHLPAEYLIAIAPLMNAGNVHKWATSIFGDDFLNNKKAAYDQIEKLIENSEPCSNGLIFLPYLSGERCPVQDPSASGCFIGLREKTTKGEMCRAVLEGVAMAIRNVTELLLNKSNVNHMTLIGGGSRTGIWCQIIADVLGTDIFVPVEAEFLPAIGAAASAFVRLGWAEDYEDYVKGQVLSKSGISIKANHKNTLKYNKLYEKYLMIYPALKPVFNTGN